jgi:hypothetical protein
VLARRLLPALLLTSVLWAAVPIAAAGAAAPPRTLREAGLLVNWPRTVIPGAVFRVNVKATRARLRTGRAFTIALVRTDARGRTLRTVARRRMRSGVFEARVPPQARRRYAAVIAADGARFRKSFPTGPALPPGVEPATPPPIGEGRPGAIDVGEPPCTQRYTGPADATARGQRQSVARGETFIFVVENTGEACLTYGAGHTVERRRADGGWDRVPLDEVWTHIAYYLPPGGTYEKRRPVPADWQPGRYRVVDNLSYDGPRDARGGAPRLTVQAEFDVV